MAGQVVKVVTDLIYTTCNNVQQAVTVSIMSTGFGRSYNGLNPSDSFVPCVKAIGELLVSTRRLKSDVKQKDLSGVMENGMSGDR